MGKENFKKIQNKKVSPRPALTWKERLVGLTAGFCCGLLGSGGGAILLIFLKKNTKETEKNVLFASSSAVILCLSVFCLSFYLLFGRIEARFSLSSLFGAALGGCIGALLLSKLPGRILGKFFSGMLLLGGGLMLFLGR